jgi:putative phosphoribosyl transferase
MPFTDRAEAGRKLAALLETYKDADPVVLALPRGGVPVAAEIARALDCPLDLLLVRKIGVPFQPELAMGAVVDGHTPVTVRNEDVIAMAGISEARFAAVRDAELAEIARRHRDYLGERPSAPIEGRTAIVVDDGIATGATTRAALRAVRLQKPKALVLAVPVGPTETLADMARDADAVVAVERHDNFGAIGFFYRDFHQLDDADVTAILDQFPPKTN